VPGQKNEFHALEKFYNYLPQSSIEEIDIVGQKNKFVPKFDIFWVSGGCKKNLVQK
jgi:hypothetical protein